MKIERLWQGNAVTIVGTVELDTLEARIEALDKERDAWKDAALKQAKALGAARILDDRDWANMPVFVKAAQALDTALRSEEER